jgi:hypothetical protein
MESNKGEGNPELPVTPSRALDRVSHLFLSQTDRANRERYREAPEGTMEATPENQTPAVVLLASRPVGHGQLISLLREHPAALEEGMKVIDAILPCETPGDIELVGLDSTKRLAVIDVDDRPNDSLLLRGLAHLDWVVRNTPLLRRTYQGQVINFSLQPRLILVAPDFSLLFRSALHQIQPLQIDCLKYYTIALPGGTGFFCERLFGNPRDSRIGG